jgi:hypothetical protein
MLAYVRKQKFELNVLSVVLIWYYAENRQQEWIDCQSQIFQNVQLQRERELEVDVVVVVHKKTVLCLILDLLCLHSIDPVKSNV